MTFTSLAMAKEIVSIVTEPERKTEKQDGDVVTTRLYCTYCFPNLEEPSMLGNSPKKQVPR